MAFCRAGKEIGRLVSGRPNEHAKTRTTNGEHDGDVAEASNSNDTNLLARPATVPLEGREDGQSSAHERGGVLSLEVIGDLEDKVLVSPDGGTVAPLRSVSIGVGALVGENGSLRAVLLVVGFAVLAARAGADLGSDSDEVSDLELSARLLSELSNPSDDLVSAVRKIDRSVQRFNRSRSGNSKRHQTHPTTQG